MTEREQTLKGLQQLNAELECRVKQRTAEAELRATQLHENQQRLRGVLDAAPDAIISMDAQGFIQDINPATEQIFGYLPKDLTNKNIQLLRKPTLSKYESPRLA